MYASSPRIVVTKAMTRVSQTIAGGCGGSLYVVDSFSQIFAVSMSGSTQFVANLGTTVNKLRFAPDGTLYGRAMNSGRRVMVNIDTGAVTDAGTFFSADWMAPAYVAEGNDPIGYFQNFGAGGSSSSFAFMAIDSDNPFAFHGLPMNYPLVANTSIGNAISNDGSAFYWLTTDVIYSANVTNGSMQPFRSLGSLELSPDAVVSNVDDAGRLYIADSVLLYTVDTNTRTATSVKLQGINFVTDVIWRPCPRGGVRITPTAGLITTESGAKAGFNAVLTAAPLGNVTIGLASSDMGEGIIYPTSINFTPSNWNFAQNVTIYGVDDQVVDGDQPYTIVTSNTTSVATSVDPNYSNRFVQDVHVVNAEQPGLTATTIHSSLNPSAAGAAVTFTATVIAANATPEGSMQFSDGGSTIGNPTLSNGVASFTTSKLPASTHTISAYYPGDGFFLLPSSATLSQEVKPDPSTTALTSSINPSAPGAPVTLTATVSAGSGKNKATGSVRFDDGDTTIGTATLGHNDKAVVVAPFAGGTHTLRATYLGSSSYDPSVSPAFVQNVGAVATLTITSSLNPSTHGASVTFTAAVTGMVGNPAPTGTVSFSDGTTLLHSGSVIGGTATCSTSSLTAGMHSITAHYSGDSVYAGASAVVKQDVKVPHTH